MVVINFFMANLWWFLFGAFVIGMVADGFITHNVLLGYVLPFLTLCLWVVLTLVFQDGEPDAVRYADRTAKAAARQAEIDAIVRDCDKIGERDPASAFERRQVVYRCPGVDGKPAVEYWINQ
nr:hypothetical protein [uncultured bacterium]